MIDRNTRWKWMGGAGAALLGVALAGCGQNDAADKTTIATTDTTTTNAAAPMDGNMASTIGYENAAKTWGQIEMARASLDKVVMDKKTKDVHEGAFKVRDLVKTLPAQSAALSEDKLKSLNSHVTEVTQLAGMMDEAGDANNEKSTHEHHMAMNDALDMMRGLYPADALGSNMHMPGMKKPNGGMSAGAGMPDDKMPMADKPMPMGDDKMPMMDDKMPMGDKPMPKKSMSGGARKPMSDKPMPMDDDMPGHM